MDVKVVGLITNTLVDDDCVHVSVIMAKINNLTSSLCISPSSASFYPSVVFFFFIFLMPLLLLKAEPEGLKETGDNQGPKVQVFHHHYS